MRTKIQRLNLETTIKYKQFVSARISAKKSSFWMSRKNALIGAKDCILADGTIKQVGIKLKKPKENQFAILFENRLPNSSFNNSSFTQIF